MQNKITRKEAKLRNLKYYFTDKPCKHGHISERIVRNGECLTCQQMRHNSEKFKERKRKYSKEITKNGKRKEYRIKNRERINSQKRKWGKKWRNTPKGIITKRIEAENRRALIKKQTPNLTKCEKAQIFEVYYKAWCYSQVEMWDFHVDHIIPLTKGGLHHPDNLQILESVTNIRKGDKIL